MDAETLLYYIRQLQENWSNWNDLERGHVVVLLCNADVIKRKLARLVGCSESLIRHIEIVGRMPDIWKRFLVNGYSTRRVVGWWRDEQRRQAAERR